MEVRPRRAAEAFWRCEQAFERRTRDMFFFPFPPCLYISLFVLSGRVRDDEIEGALGAGFRGTEIEFRRPNWSPGHRRARGGEQRQANILLVGAMNRVCLSRGSGPIENVDVDKWIY